MSAGAWPICCCGSRPSDLWHADGGAGHHRRRGPGSVGGGRRSVPNSWPASPWVVVRRPGMRPSSRAVSGSHSCSASVERPPISRHWRWAWSMAELGHLIVEPDGRRYRVSHRRAGCHEGNPYSADAGDVLVTVSANVGSVARGGGRRPGRCRRASAWSGRSCCSSGRRRRRPSPSSARPTPGSATRWPDRPVVFRTLDVGGDKPAAWQDRPRRGEPGPRCPRRPPRPRVGRRCSTTSSARCVEAAAGGELRVMLPMVATVDEVDRRPRAARRGRRRRWRRDGGRAVGRPARRDDRGPVGRAQSPTAWPGDGLLQHRDQRPHPVHAGHRPAEPGRRLPGHGRSSRRCCGSSTRVVAGGARPRPPRRGVRRGGRRSRW